MKVFSPKPVPPDTRPSVRECERKVIEAALQTHRYVVVPLALREAVLELKKAMRREARRTCLFHVEKTGRWGLLSFENGKASWARGMGVAWREADAEKIAELVGGTVGVCFR